jgi:hypothetical protein
VRSHLPLVSEKNCRPGQLALAWLLGHRLDLVPMPRQPPKSLTPPISSSTYFADAEAAGNTELHQDGRR